MSDGAIMLVHPHTGLTVDDAPAATPAPDVTGLNVADRLANHASVAAAKGILLDWDGCVVVGNRILPGARRLLTLHADKVAIVSNNSTHLPEQFSAFLARAGLIVPESRIILAGAEAVTWVAQAPGASRVTLFGSPEMRSFAQKLGVDLVRSDPDLVLLMRDTGFGYNQLARAASALKRGARLVVANTDRTHPGVSGDIIPETGALLAALMTCVPDIVPVVIGKPEPRLFARACSVLGVAQSDALMIGDNADTDIAGAAAFGIESLHVSPQALEHLDMLVPAD